MTWMLIDGNNWFARDWYATRHTIKPDLTTQFVNRLRIIATQFELDRVVVAWDSPNSFRKQLCETYKSNRDGKTDDYLDALRKVQTEMPSHGIDCLRCDGFEADDIIATLVYIANQEGERATIFSSDKDLHQLLRPGSISQVTSMEKANPTQYALKTMTADSLLKKFGVKPHQWVDYRVITGDPSDGIGGIEGLGPSVAQKVLSKCPNLDRFALEPFRAEISPKQRARLLNSRKQWDELRRLLTLRSDVPLPATWFASLHGAPT